MSLSNISISIFGANVVVVNEINSRCLFAISAKVQDNAIFASCAK